MNREQFAAALKHGWRSGLEETIANQLESLDIRYKYEAETFEYVQPESIRKYTPDFILEKKSGGVMIIETKGRWTPADRKKIGLFLKSHPDVDFRMVFNRSKQRISKTSQTTYGMWCEKLGIPYADRVIPQEWLDEVK